MVWAKTKKVELLVNGEDLAVTFSIPTAAQWEDTLPDLAGKFPKFSGIFKRYVTNVEGLGLSSPDELVEMPGAVEIVRLVATEIIKTTTLEVTLKNAPSSSTAS